MDAIKRCFLLIRDLIEVEDEMGYTYSYDRKAKNWINDIGSMQRTEGYKIYG